MRGRLSARRQLRFDIIDGRIWFQYDGTERDTAPDLFVVGAPENRIVLGFEPSKWRRFTGHAASPT